jgi:hypothetical protein
VNAVMPGFVLTEMTKALTAKNIEALKGGIPMGSGSDGSEVKKKEKTPHRFADEDNGH